MGNPALHKVRNFKWPYAKMAMLYLQRYLWNVNMIKSVLIGKFLRCFLKEGYARKSLLQWNRKWTEKLKHSKKILFNETKLKRVRCKSGIVNFAWMVTLMHCVLCIKFRSIFFAKISFRQWKSLQKQKFWFVYAKIFGINFLQNSFEIFDLLFKITYFRKKKFNNPFSRTFCLRTV